MIIVKFSGGLGNQMFQYAMYKSLQEKYPQTEVKADISFYNNVVIHQGFELNQVFDLGQRGKLTLSSSMDYKLTTGEMETQWWIREGSFLEKVWAWFNARSRERMRHDKGIYYLQEESSHEKLNEDIREERTQKLLEKLGCLDTTKNWYIDGYWQDERYFEKSLENLFEDFKFPVLTDMRDIALKKQVTETEAVAIHVRRGDYVGSRYDIQLKDYYRNAVKYIEEMANSNNLVFYIFSEDGEYVKDNFRWIGDYKLVDWHPDGESFRDMQLMSLCKYQIIANSSFSTWAGYLNQNPDRLICYPSKYTNELATLSKKQNGWICIEV